MRKLLMTKFGTLSPAAGPGSVLKKLLAAPGTAVCGAVGVISGLEGEALP